MSEAPKDPKIPSDETTRQVAILVFDGVYLLDFCGPMEIFQDACTVAEKPLFRTWLVAPKNRTVKAHTGLALFADHDFASCPAADILVVPGGNSSLAKEEPSLVPWLRALVPRTEITLSVCTGAFLLADAGLLDGESATTWHGAHERFAAAHPQVRLQAEERFVDNGRIVTTAGVSAGIDGALHVVERLHGQRLAERIAAFIEWPRAFPAELSRPAGVE